MWSKNNISRPFDFTVYCLEGDSAGTALVRKHIPPESDVMVTAVLPSILYFEIRCDSTVYSVCGQSEHSIK